ncbi:MAG: hypothetical protein QOJ50_1332, partial [Cryptosporangiaceae bacterium]|nr:hypothetical protein [Cryptosporangiaceae bacterium]
AAALWSAFRPAGRGRAVIGEGAPGTVPGSYLVSLEDTTLTPSAVTSVSDELARKYGGTIRHRFTAAMRGFSITMKATEAGKLASDPHVAYVQANRRFRISSLPPQAAVPPALATAGQGAANVTVYVLDTGIMLDHTEFGGRAVSGIDTVDEDGDATDCNGHGTHVAGVIGGARYGIAKNVHLVAVRVLDCAGIGTDATVIAGIDWVTGRAAPPAVVNLSLAGPVGPTLHWVIKNSIDSGITYVLAAGNSSGDACQTSPAHVPDAITVAAVDRNDQRALFSNYGSCVDLFAPGTGVTAATIGSPTALATRSGTSVAAAEVTGAAALFLEKEPQASPAQVRAALIAEAKSGKVVNPGSGSPNRLLVAAGAQQGPPAPERPPMPDPSPLLPLPTPPPRPSRPPRPAPDPRACGTFSQTRRIYLPAQGMAQSAISVRCAGNASKDTLVRLAITHPRAGELAVTLVAPDGRQYPLLGPDPASVSANVITLVTVDASASPRTGTWRLVIVDTVAGNAGTLVSWYLRP